MALSESASCRIVTVSPSLNLIASLVHKIRKLDGSAKIVENGDQIPWTISNKYYNAPVHFLAHTIKGLAPHLFQGVPAVIFIWPKGQAYKHHILRVTQDLTGSNPEVCLAVMLPPTADLQDDPEEYPEEMAAMDEFLLSKGFELIDATNDEQDRNYISSFPRIFDALSTIMWPSIQSSAFSQTSRAHDYAFFDSIESSGSFDISDDEFVVKRPSIGPAGQSRAQKQMAELERWLEEDVEEEEMRRQRKADPWRNQTEDELVQSPTEIEFQLDGNHMKFDDDFTMFVSAPPLPSSTSTVDPAGLTSSFAGSLYHSLGSQSDLGVNDDEDEDYLPSTEEVLKTAGEIFGTADLPETFEFSDEDDQFAPFDLSRVFDTLQGMKAEIANIDEHERRKAAAKVALGLVYGLELEQTRTQ